MRAFALSFLYAAALFQISLFSEEGGFCRKCEIMREYHKNNPSKYKYYEDYLKDLEEKGAKSVTPSVKDLPPDVQFIMEQEVVSEKGPEKKK